MRVILDTEKKTITVPWNYQQKLNELNETIKAYGGEKSQELTFTGYIDGLWKECIAESDKCVITGKKPVRKTT